MTQEPNAILTEQQEREREARVKALEELRHSHLMAVAAYEKLLALEGRTFKEKKTA